MSLKPGTSILINGLVIAGVVAGAAFPPIWVVVALLVVGIVINKINSLFEGKTKEKEGS